MDIENRKIEDTISLSQSIVP